MSPSKKTKTSQKNAFEPSRALYEQANPEHNRYRATPGLTEALVREISAQKKEPAWMLKKRLQAFALYQNKPLPTWGPDLSGLNLDEIVYFVRPDTEEAVAWNKVPEDIKKTFDRLGIPEAEKTALSGVGAQYDCLTEDTLVYTSLGMKAIKNLKIGEKVFSWDEKTNSIVPTAVQAVINKGVRPVFELQTKGKKIETTYNHPFLALLDQRKPGRQRARYTKQWEYLHNLKKNDIVAIANTIPDHGKSYTFSPVTLKKMVVGRNQVRTHYPLDISHTYKKVIFPTASNEDILWLFGFYLGDGYITQPKNRDKMRIHFAIHEKDEVVRKNVRRIIKKYFDYAIITEDEFKISINSTAIALFFKKQGFLGNAHTKMIPEWVFTLPKNEKTALIAGYIDADGTVREKNKDVVITSINQHLLEQTKMLSVYCGFDTSHITSFSYKKKGHDAPGIGFRLSITGQNMSLPCVHPLKKKRLLSKLNYYGKHNSLQGTTIRKYCSDSVGFSRIQNIRYIGEKKVYDISVKKYRNFIANGFIVHNSDVVYHNLKKEWESKGVIFENMDVAVQKYPELVKKYFMTQCVPINDHKFVMLHAAVWSGGTFIYVPKNVTIDLPLQAYFRMNAEGGGQFEHTLIIADVGSKLHYIEGCFTAGTTIKTDQGEKSIENITIGDKVLTHTGSFKKVYHTQKRLHSGSLYTIVYSGDSTLSLEVTDEHPLLVARRQKKNEQNETWETEWIKPPELTVHDYLAKPIDRRVISQPSVTTTVESWNYQTKIFVPKKINLPSTPEFFRLAGYYLAEGSVSNGAYLSFSFNSNETEYLNDVENLLKEIFNIKKVHRFVHKKNNGTSLVVCSTELSRLFLQQFGKGNDKKTVPQWMQTETLEKQQQLIKGYFRGDGNYYNRYHASGFKEAFRINTTSLTLAGQIRDMLLRFNILAFLNARDRQREQRKTMYTIGITGRFMSLFGQLVGIPTASTMNSHARASLFFIDQKYAYYPIRAIESQTVTNVPVYNFSVEHDESYVASGVAAHNCSAPRYNKSALHAGCVEIFVHAGARVRYSSIENWSKNTYNLNTKRALVDADAVIEWVNGNMGSGCTMLYPSSILRGQGAHADSLGIAFAGPGQHQDTGAKAIHAAPNTSSTIVSKSISVNGGINTFRGLIHVTPVAKNTTASMVCDALLIGSKAIANTIPELKIKNEQVNVAHEARVGKIGEQEIFYLQSRGFSEDEAIKLVVSGFISPIVKSLPVEYALELNKLIELEMEGAVG